MIKHTFTLGNRGMIDPRCSYTKTLKVTHPREIKMDAHLTLVLLSDEPDLPVGEEVKVWMSRWFHCETLEYIEFQESERQRAAVEREREEEKRREELRVKRNTLREEALAFNQSLNIPVQWRTGFKDVLSGLSEYSMGDGRNRATVGHIELLEPLKDGRLVREAGSSYVPGTKANNGLLTLTIWLLMGMATAMMPELPAKPVLNLQNDGACKLHRPTTETQGIIMIGDRSWNFR